MAIQKVADRATVNSNSAVTTADFVLTGLTVDNVLIIRTAADNSGTSGAARTITVTNQSGTPINTATHLTFQQNNDPGNASQGTTLNVVIARITATSGTVRITYSGSVVQAGVAEEWSGIDVTSFVVGTPVGANGTASTNLASVTDASIALGNVAYGAIAIEGPASDTITGDSDTVNGSWVALTKAGTSLATADTNQTVYGGYKIVTSAGSQTFNPTINNARDSAGLIIELKSDPNVSIAVPVSTSSSLAQETTVSTGSTVVVPQLTSSASMLEVFVDVPFIPSNFCYRMYGTTIYGGLTNIPAFGKNIVGYQSAYVDGSVPTQSSSQSVFLWGRESLVANQSAYIRSYKEKSTAYVYEYVRSAVPLVGGQLAFLNGPPSISSMPAYVVAETFIHNTRGFYVYEYVLDVFSDFPTQPSYMRGHVGVTGSKSVYIQSGEFLAGTRVAYIYEFAGHANFASKNCYVQVTTPIQPNKLSYVSGPHIATGTQGCYMQCIEDVSVLKRAHVFGHYQISDVQNAFIKVGEPVSDSQSCHIRIADPISDMQLAYLRGRQSQTVGVYCYIDSRHVITSAQLSYVHIQTPSTASKFCFVQVHGAISALKRCHIRSFGTLQQPQNCFINGANKAPSFKPAYIHIQTPVNAPIKRCYIDWRPTLTSSVMCYMFQTGIFNVSKLVYLNGTRVGEVDNVRLAYIGGGSVHNIVHASPLLAYINGSIVTKTGSHKCFIVNYGLIADWRLDDGQRDYGTSISNDYSSVDNDGINVNFPSYVEGTYREDC